MSSWRHFIKIPCGENVVGTVDRIRGDIQILSPVRLKRKTNGGSLDCHKHHWILSEHLRVFEIKGNWANADIEATD